MSAYARGFNDCMDGLYCNRYTYGSQQWHAYVMGFTDARRNKYYERIRH